MKWQIDDIPFFIAVAENEGITAAANKLNMPKSSISKALNRLEDTLGVRLLERNSRNVRVTSEGETFYRHCLLIMEQVEETNATMGGLVARPHGRLVVALPMAFCREIIAPNLSKFHEEFPDIDLEIIVTSRSVDIIKEQIDMAVVVGKQIDSNLITKTIYQAQLLWVTSSEYAERNNLGEMPEHLLSHIQICEKRYGERSFPIHTPDLTTRINLRKNITHVNDPISVREAIINGCGVSLIPDQYCKKKLADGSLIQVYKHISIERKASALSVVYPSRRLLSNKTKAFLSFLTETCNHI